MRPATLLFTAMGAAVLLTTRGVAFGVDDTNTPLDQQHKKDRGLLAAGFEPDEGNHLWKRDGVSFGREAALQYAWQERSEHKRRKSFEEV